MQKGLVAQMGGKFKSRSGYRASLDIWRYHGGIKGFYIGFPLREWCSCLLGTRAHPAPLLDICRDTLGTAFYFGFYDTIRSLVTRYSSGNSKTGPQLFGLPGPVVSFLSGSTAGIASWLIGELELSSGCCIPCSLSARSSLPRRLAQDERATADTVGPPSPADWLPALQAPPPRTATARPVETGHICQALLAVIQRTGRQCRAQLHLVSGWRAGQGGARKLTEPSLRPPSQSRPHLDTH